MTCVLKNRSDDFSLQIISNSFCAQSLWLFWQVFILLQTWIYLNPVPLFSKIVRWNLLWERVPATYRFNAISCCRRCSITKPSNSHVNTRTADVQSANAISCSNPNLRSTFENKGSDLSNYLNRSEVDYIKVTISVALSFQYINNIMLL